MLRRKIREEHESIQIQIEEIEERLKEMPEGKLLFSKSQNSIKWYVSDGHEKKYLHKKDRQLAEQLAIKKYLTEKLSYLKKEKRALEYYLRHSVEKKDVYETLLESGSDYSKLLSSHFKPKNERLAEWMEAPYVKNMNYSENLIHKTSSGIMVRSKSEAMIELFLHTNRIPFRYECALTLNQMTVYPDFTIRHPETGKVYYWEHFGRMDDMAYVRGTCSKLQLYASEGIIPSIQLITTYETRDNPLTYSEIERIGAQYFL